jgi:hypothetical protein
VRHRKPAGRQAGRQAGSSASDADAMPVPFDLFDGVLARTQGAPPPAACLRLPICRKRFDRFNDDNFSSAAFGNAEAGLPPGAAVAAPAAAGAGAAAGQGPGAIQLSNGKSLSMGSKDLEGELSGERSEGGGAHMLWPVGSAPCLPVCLPTAAPSSVTECAPTTLLSCAPSATTCSRPKRGRQLGADTPRGRGWLSTRQCRGGAVWRQCLCIHADRWQHSLR